MGICEILTIIFVVLKVLGIGVVASWTWFQVFIPMMIALALYIVGIVIFIIVACCK